MRFSQGYKPSGVVRQQQPDISIGVARLDELARMGLESSPAGLEFIDPCSVVRQRPLDYSGSAGLVWAINGGRLPSYIEIGQSSTSQ
jgi:hypothetical protein